MAEWIEDSKGNKTLFSEGLPVAYRGKLGPIRTFINNFIRKLEDTTEKEEMNLLLHKYRLKEFKDRN